MVVEDRNGSEGMKPDPTKADSRAKHLSEERARENALVQMNRRLGWLGRTISMPVAGNFADVTGITSVTFDPCTDNMADVKDEQEQHELEPMHEPLEKTYARRLERIARSFNCTAEEFLMVAEGRVPGKSLEIQTKTVAIPLSWPPELHDKVHRRVDELRRATGDKNLSIVGFIAETLSELPTLEHLVDMPIPEPVKAGPRLKSARTEGQRRRLGITVPEWVATTLDLAAELRPEPKLKKTSIIKALVEARLAREHAPANDPEATP